MVPSASHLPSGSAGCWSCAAAMAQLTKEIHRPGWKSCSSAPRQSVKVIDSPLSLLTSHNQTWHMGSDAELQKLQ